MKLSNIVIQRCRQIETIQEENNNQNVDPDIENLYNILREKGSLFFPDNRKAFPDSRIKSSFKERNFAYAMVDCLTLPDNQKPYKIANAILEMISGEDVSGDFEYQDAYGIDSEGSEGITTVKPKIDKFGNLSTKMEKGYHSDEDIAESSERIMKNIVYGLARKKIILWDELCGSGYGSETPEEEGSLHNAAFRLLADKLIKAPEWFIDFYKKQVEFLSIKRSEPKEGSFFQQ